MSRVGIIANPASGKDIRRLVARASVFDNNEKINILQRILLALDAAQVDDVLIMPEYYGMGERAIDGVHLAHTRAGVLEMEVKAKDTDSTVAARRLAEWEAGALLVLGGDGTNRMVAMGSGAVPLVPVSTGTNNVFPTMVEGTVAGLAAALLARGEVDVEAVSYQAKRLEVCLDGVVKETALVDVVTSRELFIGTRAIWDPRQILDIVLARSEPGGIGLSAVGSCLQAVSSRDPHGMCLRLGEGGLHVLAPMGPGLVTSVPIREHHLLPLGAEVSVSPETKTIALDGERSMEIYGQPAVTVRLTAAGPRVVDIPRCMAQATQRAVFQRLGELSQRK